MGTITRHTNAPFANTETLDGGELEQDIAAAFGAINGNLDNTNIVAGADIAGSKLLAGSVAADRVTTDTLTVTQMAAAVMTQVQFDTLTTQTLLQPSNDTAWSDISDFAELTFTAYGATDVLTLDCTVIVRQTNTLADVTMDFGFEVNGVATNPTVRHEFVQDVAEYISVSFHYCAVVPVTDSAFVVKPQYRRNAGTGGTSFTFQSTTSSLDSIFRASIFPQK